MSSSSDSGGSLPISLVARSLSHQHHRDDMADDLLSDVKLFETSIRDNVIELRDVIINEFHVLRKFYITSLCDSLLRISLDSDLGCQVGFQLWNENLEGTEGSDEGCGDPNAGTFLADDFNEVFNTVTLVDDFFLSPRQVQQVIVTFRPDEAFLEGRKHVHIARHGDNLQTGFEAAVSNERDGDNMSGNLPLAHVVSSGKVSHTINGKIFLSAVVVEPDSAVVQDSAFLPSLQQQEEVVEFQATVHYAVLKADVADLVFDDCVPGDVFVKDFSIWNVSEIPCSFQIHMKGSHVESQAFEITDYESCLALTGGEIRSCAHRRIRVTYKPQDVGDFDYQLSIENNYDVRNSFVIPVHCVVAFEHKQEGLVVTGLGEDGVLAFGDCYTDNATWKMITIRNVTQETLFVSLSTDLQDGDRAEFYLHTDLDSPEITPLDKKLQEGIENDEVLLPFSFPSKKKALDARSSQAQEDEQETQDDVQKKNRVEEVSLGRGQEKKLYVRYYPVQVEGVDEVKSLRLQRRAFRISLKCGGDPHRNKQRYSKIIKCKARVCSSVVKTSATEVNLGDCNIGSFKTASVEILNLSDLPALISAHVSSTVLSFQSKADHVLIPPRQSHTLAMALAPMRVNPRYRKQVQVENLYNKRNCQVFEVHANNMDRHHVLLHSLYYKLVTPSLSNVLNFDNVIVNNPTARTLKICNITKDKLVLGFNTSLPQEMNIYELRQRESEDDRAVEYDDPWSLDNYGSADDRRRRNHTSSVNKEKVLETLEESHPRLNNPVLVTSSTFEIREGLKSISAPKSATSADLKQARIRMSLDLATSSEKTLSAYEGGAALDLTSAGGVSFESGEGASTGSRNEKRETVKEVGRNLKRVKSSAVLPADDHIVGEESLAPQVKNSRMHALVEALLRVGELTVSNSVFADERAEKAYVDAQIRFRDLAMKSLHEVPRDLMPVTRLELLPGEEKVLYVILIVSGDVRPSIHGRLRKLAAKINVQLLEFDKSIQEQMEPGLLESKSLPDVWTRELPVQLKVSRSCMSLAQKNINFGHMMTNEHRAKTLVLSNTSDVLLLYKIRKTGSIASGDLHIIDGRVGVIRPHCSREINFVFQPSLAGSFYETLTMSNVLDPSNDQVVVLKATIRKADTFSLSTSGLNLGVCVLGEWTAQQLVFVTNTSKQTREFTVKGADPFDWEAVWPELGGRSAHDLGIIFPRLQFQLESKRIQQGMDLQASQEEIQALERKVMAFERKGKMDRAAKVKRQIEEFRGKAGSGMNAREEKREEDKDERDGVDVGSLDPSFGAKAASEEGLGCIATELSEGVSGRNMLMSNPGSCSGDSASIINVEASTSENEGKGAKLSHCPVKVSDKMISFSVKGGDCQGVFVSCMSTTMDGCAPVQRIQGMLFVFESKNQDVKKPVLFEAVICEDHSVREKVVAGTLQPDSSTALLTARLPGRIPSYMGFAGSPSLSPASSAPESPRNMKPIPSHSGSLLSESLSSERLNAGLAPSRNSMEVLYRTGEHLTDSLPSASWNVNPQLSAWGLGYHGEFTDYHLISEMSSGAASRPGSSSGLSLNDAPFEIEVLGRSAWSMSGLGTSSSSDHLLGSVDGNVTELISAATWTNDVNSRVHGNTNRLVLGEAEEMHSTRSLVVAELFLEDNSSQTGLDGVVLLRSQSCRDEMLRLLFNWEEFDRPIELLVAERDSGGRDSVLSCGSTDSGGDGHSYSRVGQFLGSNDCTTDWKAVEWEPSSSVEEGNRTRSAKLQLRAGKTLKVMLSVPDLTSTLCKFERDVACTYPDEMTGVLSMSTDEIEPRQIIVRLKQLEKMLQVVPSEISFPESDLSSVLQKQVVIRNRTALPIEFFVKVSGGGLTGSSSGMAGICKDKADSLASADGSAIATSSANGSATADLPVNHQHLPVLNIIEVSRMQGQLAPFESSQLSIICRPVKPGKQSYVVLFQSPACNRESGVHISMAPRKIQCLKLPGLEENGVLDVGPCYLNGPRGGKVSPLQLENLLGEPLLLSFKSNLAKQVSISEDGEGLCRVDELIMPGHACRQVYLCLRPSGDSSVYEQGQCREIVGGLRITVKVARTGSGTWTGITDGSGGTQHHWQEGVVDEVTVKFKAMAGMSLLRLSSSFIDLGAVKGVGGSVCGQFTIVNGSSQLPLKFLVQTTLAKVSVSTGELTGRDVEALRSDGLKSEMSVEFCLPATKCGLLQDRILVWDLMCPGEKREVLLRLFVDEGFLNLEVGLGIDKHKNRLQQSVNNNACTNGAPSPTPSSGRDGKRECGIIIDQAVERRTNNNNEYETVNGRETNFMGSFVQGISVSEKRRWNPAGLRCGGGFEPPPACLSSASRKHSIQKLNTCPRPYGVCGASTSGEILPTSVLNLGDICLSPMFGYCATTGTSSNIAVEGPELAQFYMVTDIRPYHGSFRIVNCCEKSIGILPVSNLPVWVSGDDAAKQNLGEEDLNSKSEAGKATRTDDSMCDLLADWGWRDTVDELGVSLISETDTGFAACGEPLELAPGQAVRCLVRCCETIQPLPVGHLARLMGGKLCNFEGSLILYKVDHHHTSHSFAEMESCMDAVAKGCGDIVGTPTDLMGSIVKTLSIRGAFCVSNLELSPDHVDLGKIGHANMWEDVEFEVRVCNMSETELIYEMVDVPSLFKVCYVDEDNGRERCGVVPPGGAGTVKIQLRTSALEHRKEGGHEQWVIRVENCNNPGNAIDLTVSAELTVCSLRINGLVDRVLLMPPLLMPAPSSGLDCMGSFMVENLSEAPLGVAFELQQVEALANVVALDICSYLNGAPIRELTLSGLEKAEIYVRMRPLSDFVPAGSPLQSCIPLSSKLDDVEKTVGKSGSASRRTSVPSSRSNSMHGLSPNLSAIAGSSRTHRSSSSAICDLVPGLSRADANGTNDGALRSGCQAEWQCVADESRQELTNSVALGQLLLYSSPHVPDSVMIRGSLFQGPVFDVSPHNLSLQANMTVTGAEEGLALSLRGGSHDTDFCRPLIAETVKDEVASRDVQMGQEDREKARGRLRKASDDMDSVATVTLRNFLAFNVLRFRVVLEADVLNDGEWRQHQQKGNDECDAASSSHLLIITPIEGSVPPHGTLDLRVRAQAWSQQLYHRLLDAVLSLKGPDGGPLREGGCCLDIIRARMSVVDVDSRVAAASVQNISVKLIPPTKSPWVPPVAKGRLNQTSELPAEAGSRVAASKDVRTAPPDTAIAPSIKDDGSMLNGTLAHEGEPAGRMRNHRLPVLGLKGCTPVSGSPSCYEFDLGPQDLSSGSVHWELILIGDDQEPIEYSLCTLNEDDEQWLSINSTCGILDPSKQQTIQLSFSTRSMGVFFTHLIVENCNNPEDLKTVRLSVEVVAPRNLRHDMPVQTFFHVLVNGRRAEDVGIDMGEVFYNFWYRNRSFVIVNDAPVAMEFLLSSSVGHTLSTELNFSLANTSLKRFNSLTIDSKSSLRVWIHFCPGVPFNMDLVEEDTAQELSATVIINCRLIKDYQQCIPFRAKCRPPQIGISTTDVVFWTPRPVFSCVRSVSSLASSSASSSAAAAGTSAAAVVAAGREVGTEGVQHLTWNCRESQSGVNSLIQRKSGGGTTAEVLAMGGLASNVTPLSHTADVPPLDLQSSGKWRGEGEGMGMVSNGYVAKLGRKEELELQPALHTVVVSNLYSKRDLRYTVRNSSLFFIAQTPETQVIRGIDTIDDNEALDDAAELCSGDGDCQTTDHNDRREAVKQPQKKRELFHVIQVRPNLDALRVHEQLIRKQKYVEEHLTIYNMSNPREKYSVSLRITTGHLRDFYAAPGSKSSYPFSRLEISITRFLSLFSAFTTEHMGFGKANVKGNHGSRQRTSRISSAISLVRRGSRKDGGVSTILSQHASFTSKESGTGQLVSAGKGVGVLDQTTQLEEVEKQLETVLQGAEGSPPRKMYEELAFEFHCLTDELVFYSLKERWSRGGASLELTTIQLAKLLYCVVYKCQIFQQCVDSCEFYHAVVAAAASRANTLQEEDASSDEEERKSRSRQSFRRSVRRGSMAGFETQTVSGSQVVLGGTSGGAGGMYGAIAVPGSGSSGGSGVGLAHEVDSLPEEVVKELRALVAPKLSTQFLENWGGQLRHLLSFFPDKRLDLLPLRDLNDRMQKAVELCQFALNLVK